MNSGFKLKPVLFVLDPVAPGRDPLAGVDAGKDSCHRLIVSAVRSVA